MKMNKLFTSLATSVMVLSTVAPVAVANAAGETGGGETSGETEPTGDIDPLEPNYANKQYNAKTGYTHMYSNANVKVVDGVLALESVPSFGFGNAVAGHTKSAVNFKPSVGDQNSVLSITESRHTGSGDTLVNGLGYNVFVSMSGFSDADKNSTETFGSDKWQLDLPRINGYLDRQDANVHSAAVQLKSNNSASTVVAMEQGKGYGVTDFDYKNDTSNIVLHVPKTDDLTSSLGPTAGNKFKTNHTYAATLTWTLNANAASVPGNVEGDGPAAS